MAVIVADGDSWKIKTRFNFDINGDLGRMAQILLKIQSVQENEDDCSCEEDAKPDEPANKDHFGNY